MRVNTDPDFGADTTAARSVAENTAAGRDIGAPVTATDSAGDTLNYTLGGDGCRLLCHRGGHRAVARPRLR